MPDVSLLDLCVLVNALAENVRDLRQELASWETRPVPLSEEDEEEFCQLEDVLQQRERVLYDVGESYEAARDPRGNLPSFDSLLANSPRPAPPTVLA